MKNFLTSCLCALLLALASAPAAAAADDHFVVELRLFHDGGWSRLSTAPRGLAAAQQLYDHLATRFKESRFSVALRDSADDQTLAYATSEDHCEWGRAGSTP